MTKDSGKMVVRKRKNKTIMIDDQVIRWRKYRKQKWLQSKQKQEDTPQEQPKIKNIFE